MKIYRYCIKNMNDCNNFFEKENSNDNSDDDLENEYDFFLKNDLDLEKLPQKVSSLTLTSKKHNNIINIPLHIKKLKLLGYFGNFAKDLFSNTHLICLELNKYFYQEIEENFFPSTLKKLNFGNSYDIELKPNILPIELEEIIFGNKFNKPISKNTFPQKLKILRFGWAFNHKLSKILFPTGLKELHLGGIYNYNISYELPDNLERLYLSNNYNNEIQKHSLPKNILTLKFNPNYSKYIAEDILPKNIIDLSFSLNCNGIFTKKNLPPNLEELNYETYYERSLLRKNKNKENTKILSIPEKIKKLIIKNEYIVLSPDIFINSLEYLKLDIQYINSKFDTKIILPDKLKYIDISIAKQKKYNFIFPEKVNTLRLINIKLLDLKLPEKLKTLIINQDENICQLPMNLKHIVFEGYPTNNLTNNLPILLETIKINRYFLPHIKSNGMLKKIPYGCKIIDTKDKEIFL